jgi:hypothetical protein
MGWRGALRAAEAAHRRRERDEVKRLRDLERQTKEQAKLSAVEQARLEVETHESRINLLLSIHKEPIEVWNWQELIAALDPCTPCVSSPNELREKLIACAELREIEGKTLEGRRAEDRQALEQALAEHTASLEVRRNHREMAARVVRGDLAAWTSAIADWRPFEELEELGAKVKCDFHSRASVHCSVAVSGPEIIPQEAKTLTSTGKLSVKPIAKTRFHEIYQDYVCGAVLRTATEMFGFLPVEVVIVTASVGFVDPMTGQFVIRPVLSAGFTRAAFSGLALDKVDPSDAIEGFVHRGDAKASRKTGSFVPVEPLRFEEVGTSQNRSARFGEAIEELCRERDEIRNHTRTLTARLRTTHQPTSAEA